MTQFNDNRPSSLSDHPFGRTIVGAVVVVLATAWAWLHLDHGWWPHDAGQLGQAAERVLNGELPHRDFDDMYVGGLSFLNGLSFYLWGVHSMSSRWMLLVCFVPFVAATYWIASDFSKPLIAGLVTLLAAAWSIPMYPAAMPSWYNLFFAVWTATAVHEFIKTGRRRLLVIAGVMVGLSIVFKISGMFVMAAVLLSLLYRNQLQFRLATDPRVGRNAVGFSPVSILVVIVLAGVGLLGAVFVNRHDWEMQLVHLVTPYALMVGFVAWHEWSTNQSQDLFAEQTIARVRGLAIEIGMFVLGVSVPVVFLVAFYIHQGAWQELVHGALVLPSRRLEFAWWRFPSVVKMIFSLPLVILALPALGWLGIGPKHERLITWVTLGVAGVLLLTQFTTVGFTVAFSSIRNFAPVWVVAVLFWLRGVGESMAVERRQQIFVLTAIAFFASLIQYPYPYHVYFFYFAPLLTLSVLVVVCSQRWVPSKALVVTVVFLILVSAFRYHTALPGRAFRAGYRVDPVARLDSDRCSFQVETGQAEVYNRLTQIIQGHSKTEDCVFALPDSPEVSFMTGRSPFTGVMYDFFHPNLYADTEKLRKKMERENVQLVVVKELPPFSPKITSEFRTEVLLGFKQLDVVYRSPDPESEVVFTIYQRQSKPVVERVVE